MPVRLANESVLRFRSGSLAMEHAQARATAPKGLDRGLRWPSGSISSAHAAHLGGRRDCQRCAIPAIGKYGRAGHRDTGIQGLVRLESKMRCQTWPLAVRAQ